MKLWHRVFSMLLAFVLLFGLFPTVRPTVVEAAAADTPAGVRNHLPSTAKDVKYLSDMNWEYSINNALSTDPEPEAIKDGTWSNGGAIVMGLAASNGGTTFTKGLGVMPKGTDSNPDNASRTIFDLADNNYKQNFFYAAAGITNGTAQGGTISNGVVFEVWASYDKSQDDYTKAEYKLLERSGDPAKGTHVKGSYVYQFHLDVTGVRYLKLVVYAVDSIGYMNSNWAGVCVYNNPGYYPKSDLMGLNNGKDNSTWVPSGTDRFNTYHFNSIPADAVLLSGAGYKDASTYKGTAKMVDFKSASGNLGSGKHWFGGVADSLTNTNTNQKDGILLTDATKYWRFNARQPAASGNQADGWVTFDISDLDVNRFYTAISSGHGTAKHTAYNPDNGTYGGMKLQVWGCATKDGTYELLSESEPIMLSHAGEFLVDITGVNFLKIRLQAKDTRLINALDILFYMPCVFNEWDINATGATSAVQGTTADYTAKIRHDFDANYNYTGAVTWAVDGAQEAGTKFTGNKLTIDPAETATSLTVTASITEGGKKISSNPITVAVTKAPVYTLDITGPAEAGKNTQQNITATVTKDGAADNYDKITWSVEGGSDSSIDQTGKLTIGNEATGTKLTVKASFTEYGRTCSDTLEITVAAYAVTISGNTEMLPGSKITLNAAITNEGAAVNEKVTWSVDGNGTIVAHDNQAVVTAKDSKGTVKVTATWTTPAGNPCTATHQIGVNAYSVDLQGEATIVPQGGSLPLTATVKKNGETLENASISWKIANLATGDVTKKTGASMTLTAEEAVGTVYIVTASAEFGGLTVSDTYTVKVTDYNLTVTPSSVSVTKGETAELTAALAKGTAAVQNPAITWTVTNADGSALIASGATLKVLADAPVGTELTAVASAKVDGETIVSAPVKITVVEPIVYKVTLNKSSATVKPGDSFTFTAAVSANGTVDPNAAVTWKLTGGTKAGTKLENGVLTVDAAEAGGTTLTVTATYAAGNVSASATVTVKEAPKQEAYTSVTNGYQTVPGNAIYLADDGVVWVESVNLGNKEAIRNGAWSNGATIYIGGTAETGGTAFQKGIGVQPQSPTATNNRGASWTTIDISTYDVDTFYAAVGSTNKANQENGHNSFIYQVFGATDKNGAFTLLSESDPVAKTNTGEFKVDISGYKYLKLVIKCTDTGSHGYGNSAWANACVYNSKVDNYVVTATPSATTVQQGKSITFTAAVTKNGTAHTGETITWAVTGGTKAGTKIDSTGKLTVDKAEPAATKLNVTASITVEGTTYTSAGVVITVEEAKSNLYQADAFKTTSKYTKLAKNVIWLSDVKWVESVNYENKEAIRNGAWSNGAAIYIGGKSNNDVTDGTKFEKGIGVQPQAPTADNNRGASWTTINVANLKCDTFYAAVGGTNAANQEFGHNKFIYQVLGNTEKGGEFTLLAESAPLTKTETGEFKLNIKGIYELKLLIKCGETGNHGYGNSVWANACVFNKDGSNGNTGAMTESSATSSETPKQKKAYTSFKGGNYLTPVGKVTFISDMEWVESVNYENKEAIRNGAWSNGAAIWLGGGSKDDGGTKFVKGLGVQAQAPTADNNRGASWTTVNITDLGVDTFYAVVGGTNGSNRENGHNSFIYQVYGATKQKGKYTLLAQSEPITKRMTGEFKVNIEGYNFLKLVIKCSDTGNHGYGNSAWANACVFNSKETNLVEGDVEITQPTTPTVTKPRPTAPANTEKDDSASGGSIVVIIAISVILLIAIAVAIALLLKKKKKK